MIFMEHTRKAKFYWLLIEQDLFGCWCVRKIYGHLPNKTVGSEIIPCHSEHDAWLLLCDLEMSKRSQGYVYSNSQMSEHYELTPQLIADVENLA